MVSLYPCQLAAAGSRKYPAGKKNHPFISSLEWHGMRRQSYGKHKFLICCPEQRCFSDTEGGKTHVAFIFIKMFLFHFFYFPIDLNFIYSLRYFITVVFHLSLSSSFYLFSLCTRVNRSLFFCCDNKSWRFASSKEAKACHFQQL